MNKFYPTMSRAVARLDGDGKARHVLYDRARGALINQLEARDPPFTKTEMMGERLELEDAIRLVEAETTKRQQQAPQTKTVSVARGPDGPPAKQERVPPLEKPASPQPSKQSVNLAPSEAQHAPADVGAGNRPSFRLQPMIQAARHQLGLMAAKAAPRQPQAPQPNSLSAAAVADASPSHELSVPPPAKKAASAAPRTQPLNLARSQGPEKKIAEKAEPSSESVHAARRGASSSDQHTPPDVSEIQHASTDAGASSWLSSLLQPMIKAAPTPRQPAAPHPGSVSAARPLVEPPAKQGSIPPVETAASAALRKQSPNLASSQRPEEQIAQSSESQHGTRRDTSSTDQRTQDLPETQHASADAGASSRLSSLLQSMIQTAPTPRQPKAPHPGSASVARVPDALPAKPVTIPPVETAASAVPKQSSPHSNPVSAAAVRDEPSVQQASVPSVEKTAAAAPPKQSSPQPNPVSAAAVPDAPPAKPVTIPPVETAASAPPKQSSPHSNPVAAARVPDAPPAKQGNVPPVETTAAAVPPKQSFPHSNPVSVAAVPDATPAKQGNVTPVETAIAAAPPKPSSPQPNPVSTAAVPDAPAAKQQGVPPIEKTAAAAPPKQSFSLAPSQQPEQPIAHDKGLVASSADQHSRDVAETQHGPAEGGGGAQLPPRLQAMIQAARYQGIELDPHEFRQAESDTVPSAASLSLWAQNAGMWSRAVRVRWQHLPRLNDSGPVVLLFTDGTAGLLTGTDAAQAVVYLKDPYAPAGTAPVAVDQLRLSEVWGGEAVLLRVVRGYSAADALFNFRWLVDLVLQERRSLRDIGIASLTISVLTIFPPLLVMMMVNKVLQFHSVSTLVLLCAILAVVFIYETLLGYGRRLIISVIGARLDAKLNLHLFNRLLRLPLDYFERHPPGETMYQIAQIHRVRDFLTGKLLETFLDLITLCVLLPFLFYLNTILASIVLVCAAAITLIILAYLKPLRVLYGRVTTAETWKSAALGETIVGIKTVKALALEPQRRALWDERVAEAGKWHLAFAQLANWPQTLVTPIQRMMVLGTMMLGAYLAMNDPSGYMVGGLFAFMMLSGRVAQPLVGLARLVEDYEEVGAAIGEAGSVLNRPLETVTGAVGLRPKLVGAISFENVTFTYIGTKTPALDRVSFSIPAGTMLGIVGRSGSGKSTITRLLQGINRDYGGYLKIDGADLREVDLRHLRQSLGVVLQNNFLFRGSVRDNIIAGRPGLTLTDAVYAARLAGAEEFIERMPNGYETYIEEGSPNLSGGQTQRLAIARALIHDPRILILDEATSALDPESEAAVTANLKRIAQGRTMVLVSHRLSSLMECDQILVMEEGKVADIAPHSVLLERCPLYRQLWAQQNRHIEGQGPRHGAVAPRLVPGA